MSGTPSSAGSTRRRRWTSASTRSGPNPPSTAFPTAARLPFEWTVNPYRGCTHACLYCFARPTHEYLDMNAGRDFEREIIVKVNVPEVLRAELARPSWTREQVALGTNTDPYQWVEGRYKLMRGIWEALRDARNPCSILTKSPLVLRDVDLLKQIAEVTEVSACLSVPDAGREGVAGDRAAHAAPARAAGGGGRAQPRRDPDRDPDRAADAGDQRRAGAGRARSSSWRPRPAPRTSAATRCSCAARCGSCSSTGCASTGPTWCRATSGCTRSGAYLQARRAADDRARGRRAVGSPQTAATALPRSASGHGGGARRRGFDPAAPDRARRRRSRSSEAAAF